MIVAIFIFIFITSTVNAQCPACKENMIKKQVSYPPPPSEPVAAQEKLYKIIPVKKVQTATRIASYPVIVYPEKTVWLRLSNTDVNRVVCTQGEISFLFTSQEKGVVTEIKEDEAYIKFKSLLSASGKLKRTKTPTEFYIRCGGETYSFIAKPCAIPSRTVFLESRKKKTEVPVDILKKDSIDAAIAHIIREVFLNRVPPSWNRISLKEAVSITLLMKGAEIRVKEIKRYAIPGLPVVVRVFVISSSKSVQVSEKLLLNPNITRNPIAISIMDHIIKKKLPSQAVILERS